MSKVAMVIRDVPEPGGTMAVLTRSLPNRSLNDLRQHIAAGTPVVEANLFENDHAEVSALLRRLMRELPATDARIRIFELGPSESFGQVDLSTREISSEILLNILSEAERVLTDSETEDGDGRADS